MKNGDNVGYYVHLVRETKNPSLQVEYMADAIRVSAITLLTPLGVVLTDQYRSGSYSLYLLCGKYLGMNMKVSSEMYNGSYGGPAVSDAEENEKRRLLLALLDYLLLAKSTMPEELWVCLENSAPKLRSLLGSRFGNE